MPGQYRASSIIKDRGGVGSYGDKTYDTIEDRTIMELKKKEWDIILKPVYVTRIIRSMGMKIFFYLVQVFSLLGVHRIPQSQ